MPNWCANALHIDGPDAARFVEATQVENDTVHNLLGTFLPMPEELRDTTAPPRAENGETEAGFAARTQKLIDTYGAADWYDWAVGHWGTKWDVDADFLDGDKPAFTFETAWAPPEMWLEQVSQQFPEATFTLAYCEAGMAFAGWVKYRDGGKMEEYVYEGQWWEETEDEDDGWAEISDELEAFLEQYNIPGVGG